MGWRDKPKHGTLYGYRRQGCRCERCKKAQREAVRAYRKK